ncbi:MAG: choline-sulfatase [Acidobacteriota bacterium]
MFVRRRPTSRSRPLLLTVFGALAVAGWGLLGCRDRGADPAVTGARPPDVLLLVIDTMRADRLGALGYPKPTTPGLDALAAEGVLFRNAVAPATWTKPSMSALFASRYPSELGLAGTDTSELDKATSVLPESVELLAERFSRGGYRTAAVLQQVHLAPRWGFARGFDQYLRKQEWDAFGLNARARKVLEEADPRPLFLWVHYFDVHWPYVKQPARLPKDLFGPRELRMPARTSMKEFVARMRERPEPDTVARLANRYDAEVRYTDNAVAALIEHLRASGRLDDTVVVVTADHGEQFLEHGDFGHGNLPYDEEARVPLVVRAPERFGFRPGERATPASLLDLGPTLAELAGLPADPQARGESLVQVLAGRERPDRVVVTQSDLAWAARGVRHKVLAFEDGRREYYRLDEDPGERRDLAAACDAACTALSRRLADLREVLGRGERPATGEPLTDAEIEELRSLGYL